ncbi:MAG: hypothetical protein QXQ37_00625 [Nitrososphaerota archaeon]
MVFREKLQHLKETFDDFMKAFSDAEKALDDVLNAYRPLSNVCYELNITYPNKHPSGLFLDGRTRARLNEFRKWITEVVNNEV